MLSSLLKVWFNHYQIDRTSILFSIQRLVKEGAFNTLQKLITLGGCDGFAIELFLYKFPLVVCITPSKLSILVKTNVKIFGKTLCTPLCPSVISRTYNFCKVKFFIINFYKLMIKKWWVNGHVINNSISYKFSKLLINELR